MSAAAVIPGSIALAVIVGLLLHLTARDHQATPYPYGVAGVIIGAISTAWWPSIPAGWTALVVAAALALFLKGRKVGEEQNADDRGWHYAALAVGVAGKTAIAALVAVWPGVVAVWNWLFNSTVPAIITLALAGFIIWRELVARQARKRSATPATS